MKDTVTIIVKGGMVQGVFTTSEMNIVLVDYDNIDPERPTSHVDIIEPDGVGLTLGEIFQNEPEVTKILKDMLTKDNPFKNKKDGKA